MTKQEKALDYFRKGNNCAQSVLLSFADDLGIEKKFAENVASGFGAGMGRLQNTCGALTGSFMVIGLYNSRMIKNEEERKETTNRLIQALDQDFTELFGYSDCKGLTGMDLNTEPGQLNFDSNEVSNKVCEKCISACVSWLKKNLNN